MGGSSGRAALIAALLVVPAARAEPLPCEVDDRLSETAAGLLLGASALEPSSLLRAARMHGFDGVAVHALDHASDERARAFLDGLAHAREGRLSCGDAWSEGRWLLLASPRGGRLFRRGMRLFGRLEPGFSAPQLVLEADDGTLTLRAVSVAALARGIVLPSDAPLARVQLMAESASGPRPVAELSLDGRPPRQASAGLAPDEPRIRPLAWVLAEVAAFRQAGGAGPLRENRLLSASAQRHGEALCARGALAHRLDGEDPEARLRRAHVEARGVGEVLARAGSSRSALAALRESPAHRFALAGRDFTDIGVGQAIDAHGQVCLVVLLAAWPRRVP